MDRLTFLKSILALTMIKKTEPVSVLHNLSKEIREQDKMMPAFFIGHGSPMNAIELNEFSLNWKKIGHEIVKPSLILCVSAHWETKGTFVTANEKPPTIHDFGGFPDELFQVEYPAPGSKLWSAEISKFKETTNILENDKWGLDHGTWSILKHMYPFADVPVIQLSIDYSKEPSYHYQLAKELSKLRKKGVLIIGSGNMVHNLRMVDWSKLGETGYGFDWAIEANDKMKKFILNQNHQELVNFNKQGRAFDLAIPSAEHFIPLLYVLGVSQKNEEPVFFNDKAMMGSLTMTSVRFGEY
jgi:4,5-DOPA dioxygenase extradiol